MCAPAVPVPVDRDNHVPFLYFLYLAEKLNELRSMRQRNCAEHEEKKNHAAHAPPENAKCAALIHGAGLKSVGVIKALASSVDQ
jgi:hypothetical protein